MNTTLKDLLTPEFLEYQVKEKDFKWFDDNSKPFNFNIVEVRSKENIANVFNDWQCLIFNFQGNYEIYKYRITLDPGLFYLGKERMGNKEGTAVIMGDQQIPGYYKLGKFKGYTCLRQSAPAWFYRDYNRDSNLDLITDRKVHAIIGAHNHRGKAWGNTIEIGPWSAGCAVDENAEMFNVKMRMFEESANLWGNSWTRTILEENNFLDA